MMFKKYFYVPLEPHHHDHHQHQQDDQHLQLGPPTSPSTFDEPEELTKKVIWFCWSQFFAFFVFHHFNKNLVTWGLFLLYLPILRNPAIPRMKQEAKRPRQEEKKSNWLVCRWYNTFISFITFNKHKPVYIYWWLGNRMLNIQIHTFHSNSTDSPASTGSET